MSTGRRCHADPALHPAGASAGAGADTCRAATSSARARRVAGDAELGCRTMCRSDRRGRGRRSPPPARPARRGPVRDRHGRRAGAARARPSRRRPPPGRRRYRRSGRRRGCGRPGCADRGHRSHACPGPPPRTSTAATAPAGTSTTVVPVCQPRPTRWWWPTRCRRRRSAHRSERVEATARACVHTLDRSAPARRRVWCRRCAATRVVAAQRGGGRADPSCPSTPPPAWAAIGPDTRRGRRFGSFRRRQRDLLPADDDHERALHPHRRRHDDRSPRGPVGRHGARAAVRHRPVVQIGDRCLIGRGSGIVGHLEIVIGDDVWTGHHVYITDQNHDYADLDLPISQQSQPERPVHDRRRLVARARHGRAAGGPDRPPRRDRRQQRGDRRRSPTTASPPALPARGRSSETQASSG